HAAAVRRSAWFGVRGLPAGPHPSERLSAVRLRGVEPRRPVAEIEGPAQQLDRTGRAGATPRREGKQPVGRQPLAVVVQGPALVLGGGQRGEQFTPAVVEDQPSGVYLAGRRLELEGMSLVVELHAAKSSASERPGSADPATDQ